MKRRLKIITFLFVAGILLGLLAVFSIHQMMEESRKQENFHSEALVLLDVESGRTVFSFHDHKKQAPASLVKLMTCLVVLDRQADLGAPAKILPEAAAMASGRRASQSGLGPADETNYRDLLYATMLASDGAAAQSLAIHVAGSEEQFVKLMNRKALRMGLFRTHFTDSVGFDDPKQKSTARDMARLLQKALKDPDFYTLFTSADYAVGATSPHPQGLRIHSTVLGPGRGAAPESVELLGGKSGSTYAAGRCWASLAQVGGKHYLCIVLGAPFDSNLQMTDSFTAYDLASSLALQA